MTKYAPGQRIDIGWGEDVEFIAGCELDDGSTMMLIDTDLADGYLLVDAPAYAFDTITLGMPIPDGSWSASVTAEDLQHCSVVFRKGDETRELHYAYEYTEQGVDEWVLKRYGLRNENGDCFTAELSLFRAELSESKGGKTQTAVVYYDFFRQANNITYPKHPYSIRECRALQEKYPVAAVSPEDPTTRVNLREGPGTDYPRCGSLYAGALFSIYEMEDGWAKIRVGDTDAVSARSFWHSAKKSRTCPICGRRRTCATGSGSRSAACRTGAAEAPCRARAAGRRCASWASTTASGASSAPIRDRTISMRTTSDDADRPTFKTKKDEKDLPTLA